MKWYKFIFIFSVSLLSTKNIFRQEFESAITSAKITTANVIYRDFVDQVEFNIDKCHVIFSTKKDIQKQINTLQELQKIAKIKQSTFSLINLSVEHAYATLKNN